MKIISKQCSQPSYPLRPEACRRDDSERSRGAIRRLGNSPPPKALSLLRVAAQLNSTWTYLTCVDHQLYRSLGRITGPAERTDP